MFCTHFSRWLEGDWRLIFEVIGRWLEVIGGDWPGSPPQRTLQFACVLQHFHTSAIPRNCREQIPFIKLKRSKEKSCARVVRRACGQTLCSCPPRTFLEFYKAPLSFSSSCGCGMFASQSRLFFPSLAFFKAKSKYLLQHERFVFCVFCQLCYT